MQHPEHGKQQPNNRGKENRERLALNPVQPVCKNSPRKESLSHQEPSNGERKREHGVKKKQKLYPHLQRKRKMQYC